MIVFSPCKINLGLYITQKRSDGYHNIQTIFYPIALYDILEMIDGEAFQFTTTGTTQTIDEDSNLCIKAIRLLIEKKYMKALPKVHFHLHKNIPMGAGLGGGSSNASHTLMMMNEYFNLKLDKTLLLQLAETLGSDCPFFIEKKPCFATGKGEQLLPVDVDLSMYQIVLIKSNVSIPTPWAYQHITPQLPKYDLLKSINLPIIEWQRVINNDFEKPVFEQFPELADIKDKLYKMGALYASMSGSGSTLFGIFEKGKQYNISTLKTKYQVFIC